MKRQTLKEKYTSKDPIAFYNPTAFSAIYIMDIEYGIDDYVIVTDHTREQYFRRKLFGNGKFKMWGLLLSISDFIKTDYLRV